MTIDPFASTSPTTALSSADNTSIYVQAEEKLRELVQQGNLDAIALALKLRPQQIEVTC